MVFQDRGFQTSGRVKSSTHFFPNKVFALAWVEHRTAWRHSSGALAARAFPCWICFGHLPDGYKLFFFGRGRAGIMDMKWTARKPAGFLGGVTPTSWPCMKQIIHPQKRTPKSDSAHFAWSLWQVIVSSELLPWSNSGGLGRVTASLSQQFAMRGHKTMHLGDGFWSFLCCGRTRSIAIRELLGEFLENICCTAVFGIIKTLHGMFAISMHA